ncbi:MAG: AmmeMemoRadiSam system protein A, partial [Armatimonadota bacterium]
APVAGGTKTLIVASTDMSHYPPAQQAEEVDRAMLETVLTVQPEKVREADAELLGGDYENLHCTLCGLGPVIICMEAAKSLGASEAIELDYTNSAEADARTADRCVGYGAVAFVGHRKSRDVSEETMTEPEHVLDESQQEYLLTLARTTLKQVLSDKTLTDPVTDDPMMHQQRAVFVTLKKNGELRGCIGQIRARAPLAVAVQDAAKSAATSDPRFPPVTPDELDAIDIEISVLSPMKPVEDYRDIEVGKHGVLIQRGSRSGVFLPQVGPEQGWNREEMLQNLCARKAGLPPEAYKDSQTRLYAFTAQVFGEDK